MIIIRIIATMIIIIIILIIIMILVIIIIMIRPTPKYSDSVEAMVLNVKLQVLKIVIMTMMTIKINKKTIIKQIRIIKKKNLQLHWH